MKGNKDRNFIEFRNKALLILLLVVVFGSLLIVIINRKFIFGGKVTRKMIKEDSFTVFINNTNCSNCDNIKAFLDSENVSYEEIYEDSGDAEDIFKTYEFNTEKSVSPAVLYVKEGKLYAFLVNINETDELKYFIKNYKLSK